MVFSVLSHGLFFLLFVILWLVSLVAVMLAAIIPSFAKTIAWPAKILSAPMNFCLQIPSAEPAADTKPKPEDPAGFAM